MNKVNRIQFNNSKLHMDFIYHMVKGNESHSVRKGSVWSCSPQTHWKAKILHQVSHIFSHLFNKICLLCTSHIQFWFRDLEITVWAFWMLTQAIVFTPNPLSSLTPSCPPSPSYCYRQETCSCRQVDGPRER